MQRGVVQNQKLKARLEAIQRELSRVDGDIRTVSRAVEHPDREKALRRLKQLSEEQERLRDSGAGVRGGTDSERVMPREALDEKPAQPGGVGDDFHGSGNDPVIPKASADQRFANYFVTGGLHSVRPLRQEQRVQRNKAILMVIIAAVVLYGVISLLF